jgi:hypothetical protein
MPTKPSPTDLERIRRVILNSVAHLFAETDFDDDAGNIRFLDRDDYCIFLGLFPFNGEGEPITNEPATVWTIEVSNEQKGAEE